MCEKCNGATCEREPTFGFVHKAEHVRLICGLESADIIVFGTFVDFGETGEVDTCPLMAVGGVLLEKMCFREQRHVQCTLATFTCTW